MNTSPVVKPKSRGRLELAVTAGDCGACQTQVDRWTDKVSSQFRDLKGRESRLQDHLRNMVAPVEIEHAPGLDIGVKYEAVTPGLTFGGDFYDVFPIGGHCYAFVVGEAGGEGLEAAEQAVVLRLLVRFALCSTQSPGEAAAQVNRLCVRNGALASSASLFAAVYNTRTGTLIYVNAGHEPALRRRGRTDRVELLARTGPRIGEGPVDDFAERATILGVSDTLAIYTDGLIEHAPRCNPSLGVALLMRRVCCNDSNSAAQLAECVFAGTRGAAPPSLFRDDACLMTVIRTGDPIAEG
ncbi:PP2C family protein-serine/threonine phosphatase [Capsulimonas corticalis]|nr:PP2C family serine/threonine-protein phosphatase [Capsulimonas corticalis]